MKYNCIGYNIQLAILAIIGGSALMWNVHLLSGWQQYIPIVQYTALSMFSVVFIGKEDMKRFVEVLEIRKVMNRVDINKAKEFRKELLEFIQHNINLGYICKTTTTEEFQNYVDVSLGGYIDMMDEISKKYKI